MSTYEIINTQLVKADKVETIEFLFLRIEDGVQLTVSVKRDPGPIDDRDVLAGLRTALSLSLAALGAPMLEGTRMEPKDGSHKLN